MATYGQIRAWNAETVRSVGNSLKADKDECDRISDTVLFGNAESWAGDASDSALVERAHLSRTISDLAEDAFTVSKAVLAAADSIASVRRDQVAVDQLAAINQFHIDDAGIVSDQKAAVKFDSQAEADAYTVDRKRIQLQIVDGVTRVIRDADVADRALAAVLAAAAASSSSSRDRNPDGRDGRWKENDDQIARKGNDNFSNDWAGRAILDRYLWGGDDWVIENDPAWAQYMMANKNLRDGFVDPDGQGGTAYEGMRERNRKLAADAVRIHLSGGPAYATYDSKFHQAIENGEGMVGYQYLHGTSEPQGEFRQYGSTSVAPRPDGNYDVRIDGGYQWNDTIDPNPIYSTDRTKSLFAEIITFGKADPYNIHIGWKQQSTIVVDRNGAVISGNGWPEE